MSANLQPENPVSKLKSMTTAEAVSVRARVVADSNERFDQEMEEEKIRDQMEIHEILQRFRTDVAKEFGYCKADYIQSRSALPTFEYDQAYFHCNNWESKPKIIRQFIKELKEHVSVKVTKCTADGFVVEISIIKEANKNP
jgi:hypothetical protein